MQDLIDAYDYARWIGTPEPTKADIAKFVELAYDWYRKPVLDLSQELRDQIVYFIIKGE